MSGSQGAGSTPPGRRGPKPSALKLFVLGASVAGCVVFGLALRARDTSSLERSLLHGSAGIKHTKSGAEVRWRAEQSKVTIDASVEKLGPQAVNAVQGAFGTWLGSDPKLPGLTFDTTRGARVALEPDGKNTVLVAPIALRGHEHDLAVTLTYSDERTGAIVEADIVINSEHAFRVLSPGEGDDDSVGDSGGDRARRGSCASGGGDANRCKDGAYDLQNVVTHEVGHFFGLGEELTDNRASMYYCTSRCETHKRVLAPADTGSIASLYLAAADGPEAESESPAGCGGARIGTRGNLGEAALALGTTLLLLARRRRSGI